MESFIGLLLLFSVFFVRSFTTFIHELGHGIPALLFTKEKVKLYIGTYGQKDKTANFIIGRLEIYFKYNLLMWNTGLCVHSGKNMSINRNIIITLMGPVSSLLFGLSCFLFVGLNDLNDNLIILFSFFMVSCALDFFTNILPSSEPIILHDGTTTYNDGQHLIELFKYRSLPKGFIQGTVLYDEEKYEEALKEFEKLDPKSNDDILRFTVACHLQLKNYQEAQNSITQLFNSIKEHKLNNLDYMYAGLIKAGLKSYEESNFYYQKSLEIYPQDPGLLNNIGYNYTIIGEYENAIEYLNKALSYEPNYPFALNNRGFAKFKLGDLSGLNDLELSMKINPKNAYVHRNMGIYYFDKRAFEKAMSYFEKAFELDSETMWLNDYILKTKDRIKI